MVTSEGGIEVYRLHVWIRQISPMIWRRLMVHSDSTIADLHYTLHIAFGWSDEHLNQFHIHGQDYGVYHDGGISFLTDPNQVRLCDFGFRTNERFLYEYDLTTAGDTKCALKHVWLRRISNFIPVALAANGRHHRKTVAARWPS